MCLVPTLSPNFSFGPYTFFFLALVSTLYKTFGFSPYVKYLLKKKTKTNVVPRGTLKDKIIKFLIIIYSLFFNLKISLVPTLLAFFYISPCTLVLVLEFFIFYFKKTFNEIIMSYYCFVHYFY